MRLPCPVETAVLAVTVIVFVSFARCAGREAAGSG